MAEERKKWYDEIYNAVDMLPYSDKEAAEYYPELWAWYNSPMSHSARAKSLEKLLSNDKFRNELRDISIDGKFNELLESNKGNADAEIKGLGDAPIEDVVAWYDKAKNSIDPRNVLKNTPLYDAKGDETFYKLEDMDGDLDWFSKLAQDLGYPDTYEGYDQLEKDIKTVFNRKRNADKADKYGVVADFFMGNSLGKLKEGYLPTAGDAASDAISNIAWSIPFGKFVTPSTGASLGSRVATGLLANSIAPTINQVSKDALGSGKFDAGESISEVAGNTAINTASPLKLVLGLTGAGFGKFAGGINATPEEIGKAFAKGANLLKDKAPMLDAYIDNRIGTSSFGEWLKRQPKRIKNMFLGKEEEK